ncbi:protein of unknown function [Legionella fallonii LLAP-10]|uniref:Uncharacterized protein n=1 Tax=Legionella fallonii LLAP-10 TaxID=1212491 RepID=A0A098G378_9GAMM|nr:protein of unknown function [Legionella fallonii LLAP-10]
MVHSLIMPSVSSYMVLPVDSLERDQIEKLFRQDCFFIVFLLSLQAAWFYALFSPCGYLLIFNTKPSFICSLVFQ